jgi:hypothetical protein
MCKNAFSHPDFYNNPSHYDNELLQVDQYLSLLIGENNVQEFMKRHRFTWDSFIDESSQTSKISFFIMPAEEDF